MSKVEALGARAVIVRNISTFLRIRAHKNGAGIYRGQDHVFLQ